jgi:homopolymeric O-antigen transport system ATP-binding protein
MSHPAVRVVDLSKKFHIGVERKGGRTLREAIVDAAAAPIRRTAKLLRGEATGAAELDATHWALRDVSFEIAQSEVLGVIGRNGAGKSTLLKILSQITEPTSGFAEINGRVGSLLEVGTGFHQELSGRENIYLNGAILGMTKREIERKFDEIVSFAEIGNFLDTPVKHYSSGMYVRLAFSVAAHLEPEILLVDEVLSVGDVAFQKKCLGKMDRVRRSGRTILFVSHNMATVENLCSRTIVFQDGQIAFIGPSKDAVKFYLQSMVEQEPAEAALRDNRWANPAHRKHRSQENVIRYTGIEFKTPEGETVQFVRSGEPLVIRFHYQAHKSDIRPIFGVGIETDSGVVVSRVSTWLCGVEVPALQCGDGFIDLCLDSVNLMPGRYFLSMWLGVLGPIMYDSVDRGATLVVEDADFYGSGRSSQDKSVFMMLRCHWKCAATDERSQNGEWATQGVQEPDVEDLLRF